MNDDLFSHRGSFEEEEQPQRDNLFLWTIFILLLIGLAAACWLGSFYIFGHPEKPESYRILKKLHKIDPPKRFELTQAPPGEFLTPQKAYQRYFTMSRFDLERENEALLRDYLHNYQSTKRLVPYITGRYTIMNSYELKNTDFFGSGVVALAQSVDFPQVVVEHVYTANKETLPVLDQMLEPGLDIKLEKTMDLSAVIHIAKLSDGRLQLTIIPLLYGSYALKQGSGSFSLEPPPDLNVGAGLPIVKGQLLQDAFKTYADTLRRRHGPIPIPGVTPAIPVAQSAAATTIVRVTTPTPEPAATPAAIARATPGHEVPPESASKPSELLPARPDKATGHLAETKAHQQEEHHLDKPAATPAAVARATPEDIMKPFFPEGNAPTAQGEQHGETRPDITPAPTPRIAAAEATPPKVELTPFTLVSSPTPAVANYTGGGSWRTYAPGQMPRGRLLSLGDATDLADRGTSGERLYLQGNFYVTASGENKAVLRANSALGSMLNAVIKSNARVIVEYPAGVQPPPVKASISRNDQRPFEIRDVRRGPDGQINIFVREVTTH